MAPTVDIYSYIYCSGPCKPDSRWRLSKAHISPGKPQGVGNLEWGGNGKGMGRGWKWGDQFTSNLGPRWTGSYHTKEGFQVSKRKWKRSKKQGDCAMIVCQPIHVHIDCLTVECS